MTVQYSIPCSLIPRTGDYGRSATAFIASCVVARIGAAAAKSDAPPEEDADARRPCRRCAEEEEPIVLTRLSEGFDKRARAALEQLCTGVAC